MKQFPIVIVTGLILLSPGTARASLSRIAPNRSDAFITGPSDSNLADAEWQNGFESTSALSTDRVLTSSRQAVPDATESPLYPYIGLGVLAFAGGLFYYLIAQAIDFWRSPACRAPPSRLKVAVTAIGGIVLGFDYWFLMLWFYYCGSGSGPADFQHKVAAVGDFLRTGQMQSFADIWVAFGMAVLIPVCIIGANCFRLGRVFEQVGQDMHDELRTSQDPACKQTESATLQGSTRRNLL